MSPAYTGLPYTLQSCIAKLIVKTVKIDGCGSFPYGL